MVTSTYPISITQIQSDVSRRINRNGKLKFNSVPSIKLGIVKKLVNEFGESIIRVDGEIPVSLPIKKGGRFLFISYDQTNLTHGIHKFPAKFFPELPRWMIKKYSHEGDLILDPFSGSATTNIEALLNKRNSVGIDIDPFARFLSKVKTTPLDINLLNEVNEYLLAMMIEFKPEDIRISDIPEFPYRDNWFEKEILLELAFIKNKITSLDCDNNIKNYFLACMSSTIRAVSNADDNCTRTVIRKKLNKKIYPAFALKKFVESLLINTPRMIQFSEICPTGYTVAFPEMDARRIEFQNNIFDFALTSPPYVNAVDYPRTHQLELYWLDIANGSLSPLKKQHIGTESVTREEYKELHSFDISDIDNPLEKIYTIDPRRSYIAYKFLNDILINIREVYRVLKPGGRYAIVIGNNRIRGVVFESWKYLMKLSNKTGFEIETYLGSEIINHFIKVPREERINTDWILVLKK